MAELEKRFFSKKRKTIIKTDSSKAELFGKILRKGIRKTPNGYRWNFDLIYF